MGLSTAYYTVDGEIIGESSNGARLDYLSDALGSVTGKVDQGGVISSSARYKSYGDKLNGARYIFGWIGTMGYRASTEGIYIRARHYIQVTGSWSTQDAFWPMEPAYSYCNNNPTTYQDPSGLSGTAECNGNDERSKAIREIYAKFCRLLSNKDFINCIKKNCDNDGGEPIDEICLGILCRSTKSYVKCEDCDTVEIKCSDLCGNPNLVVQLPPCGSTPCKATMPRVISICTNSSPRNLEEKCCCAKGDAGSSICGEPGRLGEAVLHEIRHACTPNCISDKTRPEQDRNNAWAACVARCMGRFK